MIIDVKCYTPYQKPSSSCSASLNANGAEELKLDGVLSPLHLIEFRLMQRGSLLFLENISSWQMQPKPQPATVSSQEVGGYGIKEPPRL
jgi:hypothetical protein